MRFCPALNDHQTSHLVEGLTIHPKSCKTWFYTFMKDEPKLDELRDREKVLLTISMWCAGVVDSGDVDCGEDAPTQNFKSPLKSPPKTIHGALTIDCSWDSALSAQPPVGYLCRSFAIPYLSFRRKKDQDSWNFVRLLVSLSVDKY